MRLIACILFLRTALSNGRLIETLNEKIVLYIGDLTLTNTHRKRQVKSFTREKCLETEASDNHFVSKQGLGNLLLDCNAAAETNAVAWIGLRPGGSFERYGQELLEESISLPPPPGRFIMLVQRSSHGYVCASKS